MLTCFSMVSYLIEMDAPRFMNMLYELREGKDSETAMEKVYGRKVAELQMMWARWAMSRR